MCACTVQIHDATFDAIECRWSIRQLVDSFSRTPIKLFIFVIVFVQTYGVHVIVVVNVNVAVAAVNDKKQHPSKFNLYFAMEFETIEN